MRSSKAKAFRGWNITRILTLILISNFLIILLYYGIDNKSTISLLIRSTARFSLVLFLMSFSASSLHFLKKNEITNWMLSNRRFLGVSFAVSHYLHLLALMLMTFYISFNVFEDRGLIATIGGAITYLFITLMTLTSFDKPRSMITAKSWQIIHTIGGYLIWIVFAKSYLPNVISDPMSTLFSIGLLVVLMLRIIKMVKITV